MVSGLSTNYQYDDRVLEDSELWASRDPAVWEIYNKGFWLMYSDVPEYRLKARHRLPPKTRDSAARCIFFLKSGLPYGWPVLSRSASIGLAVLNLVTCGFAGKAYSVRARRGRDFGYWSFTSRAQYDEALGSPM